MNDGRQLKRDDLVYPELSYEIVGILFEVYRRVGSGHKEKYYQKCIAVELKERGRHFQEQVFIPLIYRGVHVGKLYLDFLIEDKIIVEIKKDERFSKNNIEQVYSYLKAKNLKLGILANFTKNGVKFKRIVNVD